ncbi:MAG: phage polymerase-related protein [Polaromonas sp.]|nr:phage polymerase-related protein [Polaromonas sp.]
MSLNLDQRQRAMLQEMGVRVWQPLALVADAPGAIKVIAVHAHAESAGGHFDQKNKEKTAFPELLTPVAPAAPPVVKREAAPVRSASTPAAPDSRLPDPALASTQASWHLGDAQTLYAQTAQAGGGRWLVLAETPASALARPVFDGDAGRLLGNMLRAARLDQAEAVLLAPLVRQGVAATAQALSARLALLVLEARPDVVLVMGRLAALALLQSSEPFGKLRGRVHALHGIQTIVTYDAPYLLRVPADKARAWDDLCLAMSLAAAATS